MFKKILAVILVVAICIFPIFVCENEEPKNVLDEYSYVREGFIEFDTWIFLSGPRTHKIRLNVEENITIKCRVDNGRLDVPDKFPIRKRAHEIEVNGGELFYWGYEFGYNSTMEMELRKNEEKLCYILIDILYDEEKVKCIPVVTKIEYVNDGFKL